MNQNINDELRNILDIICLEYGERLTGSANNKELGKYAKLYFEDGDFDIPSVYVTKEVGEKILNSKGKINLTVRTERISSGGSNVIARINENKEKKIVITAHLDTKYGTPGALDNGTGIAILLLLSKLIKPGMIDYCLELLLLNGEDYYSTPGQMEYMEEYLAEDSDIILAINCDGIGLKDSKTALKDLIRNY